MFLSRASADKVLPRALQFDAADYDTPEDLKYRARLNEVQYVALLKSQSDADRGKSNYHGVSRRNNGKWQSRITGIAVRSPVCFCSSLFVLACVAASRAAGACAVLWNVRHGEGGGPDLRHGVPPHLRRRGGAQLPADGLSGSGDWKNKARVGGGDPGGGQGGEAQRREPQAQPAPTGRRVGV